MQVQVRFTRAARRHRVGRAHALHVMNTSKPATSIRSQDEELRYWIGIDDRGVELEIAAVVRPDCLLVLHVMPTALRRKR
ncbi:MAG: hypothetical protein ACRDQU_15295 [Pseudonocardiaceae bacterium]